MVNRNQNHQLTEGQTQNHTKNQGLKKKKKEKKKKKFVEQTHDFHEITRNVNKCVAPMCLYVLLTMFGYAPNEMEDGVLRDLCQTWNRASVSFWTVCGAT